MSETTIRIPTPLRTFTAGSAAVTVRGATVRDALTQLGREHAGILERILDEHGNLRGFVNVYVDRRDVRGLNGLDTALPEHSTLSIIPAVAGGR